MKSNRHLNCNLISFAVTEIIDVINCGADQIGVHGMRLRGRLVARTAGLYTAGVGIVGIELDSA